MINYYEEYHEAHTAQLIQEARTYATGKPNVWSEKYPQHWENVPLKMNRLGSLFIEDEDKADLFDVSAPEWIVVHEIPTKRGLFTAITSYAPLYHFPTLFLVPIAARIPRTVFFGMRAPLPPHLTPNVFKGEWNSTVGNASKDDFCAYLSKQKFNRRKLERSASILHAIGYKQHITFVWSIQLAPFDADKVLFFYRTPPELSPNAVRAGAVQDFKVKQYMELADWFEQIVGSFGYSGPPAAAELLKVPRILNIAPQILTRLGAPNYTLRDPSWRVHEMSYQSDEVPDQSGEQAQVDITASTVKQPPRESQKVSPVAGSNDDPMVIAKRRLASGEITIEEYERIKRALES